MTMHLLRRVPKDAHSNRARHAAERRGWALLATVTLVAAGWVATTAGPGSAAGPTCTTDCYVNGTTGNDLNTGQSGDPLATIQAGVNAVSPGGTVHVAAATYIENVTVPKSEEITGAGDTTIVEPAVSDPNCGGAGGGSLCAGASNVFLIQASNVTIDNLKIDGDNPGLTSGIVADGADIDARNGIVEDFNSGVFNNTSVHDVTVDNIYLRAIYASSGGTGFNLSNNTVANVQADPSSVAIFNFGGAGTISGNHVSDSSDAIAANWSDGTTFSNNTVTNSGSGVHTDNSGGFGGGSPDLLTGNNISSCTSGGYGVWAFVPYNPPTIANNVVSGCDVGLAALASCDLAGTNSCPGSGAVPAVTFSNNQVTTTSAAGAIGLYVTTNSMGYGDGEVRANADHNVITGPGKSVYVEETGSAHAGVHANRNSVLVVQNAGATSVDATCNWWGQSSGPGAGQVSGSVATNPALASSNLNGPCPPPSAPSAPRSVSAYPGNGRATVSWQAPLHNGGSSVTGYTVTPVKAGVAQTPVVFNSTKTTEIITHLTNGVSYKFRVQATNAIGTGAMAASTGGITVGAPGAPSKPTVKNTAPGKLKVTFKAPNSNGATITSYTATCKSSNGGVANSKSGSSTKITVTGLTPTKSYSCWVTATNSRGTGPRSKSSAPTAA